MNYGAQPSDLLIVRRAAVAASRDTAWRAWTEPTEVFRWFGRGGQIELRPGGPYVIYFLEGPDGLRGGEGNTFLNYASGRMLTFTWNAPPHFGPLRDVRTQVSVEFSDRTGGGTDVTLAHYGFGTGEDWAKVHAYFEAAWTRVMQAFTAHLGAAPAAPALPPHDQGVDYIEFAAPDLAAAKKFYAGAFGWTFIDYGPDYTTFLDGRLAGGFRRAELPASATNPLIVLFARDLESAESRVRSAGGRITTPPHTFPGGRRFHFTDPNGLELAVWTDRTPDGVKIE